MARQPRSLGAHPALQLGDKRRDAVLPDSQALAGRGAVDRALDREDRVDAVNRFDRQRCLPQIGELEELAPPMAPACRFGNWTRPPPGVVEIAEPGIGVGLEYPGITGQMPGGMLAAAIARVEEHRRRRVGPAKRPVVAHAGP